MRFRLVLLVLLALAVPSLAHAQPAAGPRPVTEEQMAAARELLSALRIQDAMFASMTAVMEEQFGDEPEIAQFRDVIHAWARDLFGSQEAMDGFARIYAESFSLEDLRALTAFHRTPLGQRLVQFSIDANPRAMQVAGELAASRQADLMERLERRMSDLDAKVSKP